MENIETGKTDLLVNDGLQMEGASGVNWKEAGNWAKAIGITFFVGMGIVVLALLIVIFSNQASSVFYSMLGDNYKAAIVVTLVLIVVVITLLAINLIRFGSGMNTAINNTDQTFFEKSLSGLKNYFIVSGILSILGLLYSILVLFK